MTEKSLSQIAKEAFFQNRGMDSVTDAERAWEASAQAVRNAVIDECIEKLSGEIKGCTLGNDLIGKISDREGAMLLEQGRKVNVAILCSLKGNTDNNV